MAAASSMEAATVLALDARRQNVSSTTAAESLALVVLSSASIVGAVLAFIAVSLFARPAGGILHLLAAQCLAHVAAVVAAEPVAPPACRGAAGLLQALWLVGAVWLYLIARGLASAFRDPLESTPSSPNRLVALLAWLIPAIAAVVTQHLTHPQADVPLGCWASDGLGLAYGVGLPGITLSLVASLHLVVAWSRLHRGVALQLCAKEARRLRRRRGRELRALAELTLLSIVTYTAALLAGLSSYHHILWFIYALLASAHGLLSAIALCCSVGLFKVPTHFPRRRARRKKSRDISSSMTLLTWEPLPSPV